MRIYEFTYMNTYFYSVEYCIHHGVRLLLFSTVIISVVSSYAQGEP